MVRTYLIFMLTLVIAMGACNRSGKKKPDEEAALPKKDEKVVVKDDNGNSKSLVKLTDDALSGDNISASALKADATDRTPVAVRAVTPTIKTIKISGTETSGENTTTVNVTTAATNAATTANTGADTTTTLDEASDTTITTHDTDPSTGDSSMDTPLEGTPLKDTPPADTLAQYNASFEGIWFKATFTNNSFWSWDTLSSMNNFFSSSNYEFNEQTKKDSFLLQSKMILTMMNL